MEIISLTEELDKKYNEFLLRQDKTLLYLSVRYKQLLEEYLKCESNYLLAIDTKDDIRGVFPLMIKVNERYGNVANSLPFYGSNGGLYVDEHIDEQDKDHVRLLLLKKGYEYIKQKECVASTIITSPFENDLAWFDQNCDYHFTDDRIGQVTLLPKESDNLDNELFSSFHQKTRNMVRKAMKIGLECKDETGEKALEFLNTTHGLNMIAIGGVAKTKSFFENAMNHLDSQISIWVARYKGEPIAALMLFFFNNSVEYFTPVVLEQYRGLQPLSLIIFEAMKDAAKGGYKYWNWGGTWLTQEGVYRFKKRWGTTDKPYKYYTKVYDDRLLSYSKKILLSEYPNFYVLPFSELKTDN